jgi:hypothetical protein
VALVQALGSDDLAVHTVKPRPQSALVALINEQQPAYVVLDAAPDARVQELAEAVVATVLVPKYAERRNNRGVMEEVFDGYIAVPK